MRALMTAVLLLAAVALGPRAASAESPVPAAPAASWFGVSAEAGPAQKTSSEDVVRTMYVTIGAMSGYMFAVMPVTTAAVTAAVAGGLASMWAYDYMLAPQIAPDGPAH